MTLVIFFLRYFIFHLYESPKFLLSHGREQEAIDVLHKIAYFNKAPPPTLTLEMFQAIDETSSPSSPSSSSSVVGGGASDSQQLATRGEKLSTARKTQKVLRNFTRGLGNLKALFSNPLQAFIFILLAIAYMGDYWSFNLAGSFLPIILLRNEVSDGSGSVAETYRHYIYIYLPGILGAVLGLVSVQLPLVGRKWSLVISAILQGVAMAMYTQVYTTAGYVGLNAFEYIMQTVSGTYLTSLTYIPTYLMFLPAPECMGLLTWLLQYFNAVLYASAPELFDTSYRGSASGMLSCLGRISGIVAPFAGQHYLSSNSSGVLWLGAGGIWLSALTMVFLPVEMRNRQMF